MLKTGELDFANDLVELEADQRLWELYQTDYTVLLRHKPINALTRKEAAQALYTFIESLPTNPVPISFKRIRDRLSLLSPVKEQNRIIKLALKQLQDIGYLDHSITKKGKETFILIHRRSANLKPEQLYKVCQNGKATRLRCVETGGLFLNILIGVL